MAEAAINTIRNWVRDLVADLTPTIDEGTRFVPLGEGDKHSLRSKGDAFYRSFCVRSERDLKIFVSQLPLTREQTVVIRVGYLGQRDDERFESIIDADEELIARYLTGQPAPAGMPTPPDGPLMNIRAAEGAPDFEDLSDDEHRAVLVGYSYTVQYICDEVT